MNLKTLISSLAGCPCGRNHNVDTPEIIIEAGLTSRVGTILREKGVDGKYLHIVADKNTLNAADGLAESLEAVGFELTYTIFDNMVAADMESVVRVACDAMFSVKHMHNKCDAILGVGTGSINDICKLAAVRTGCDFAVYATAPSMDGWVSVGAAITVDGLKDSFVSKPARLILADTEVMAAAPKKLIAAGLSDLLGKYTALADWKICHMVTGEYYCEKIAAITRESVDIAVKTFQNAGKTPQEVVGALMEALCLSGVAMLLCGNSRPASGAEHHMSHFMEMMVIMAGENPDLHGRKVGLASVEVLAKYHILAERESIKIRRKPFPTEDVRRVYGRLSQGVIKENTPDPLSAVDEDAFEAKWGEIKQLLNELPTPEEVAQLIVEAGGTVEKSEVGISDELWENTKKYARYCRSRLTLMRLEDMMETQ